MKTVKTEYIKYTNVEKNIDLILKLKKEKTQVSECDIDLYYYLEIDMYKENNEYEKLCIGGRNTISGLSLKYYEGNKTLIFSPSRIPDFCIEIRKDFNLRGIGLFPYLVSLIFRDMKKYLKNDAAAYMVKIPHKTLLYCEEYELDSNNYLRRNRAYRKIGIDITYEDVKNSDKTKIGQYAIGSKIYGRLEDTALEKILENINTIKKPLGLNYYEFAIDLLKDYKNGFTFKDEKLDYLERYDYADFVETERTVKNETYDVTKVVGTNHGDYRNLTWTNALFNLKHRDTRASLSLNEEKFGNLNYYTCPIHRSKASYDSWGLTEIDGKAYIFEGNYRTIISKHLHDLDLIPKDMICLDYVEYLTINRKERRKYKALIKWLEKHYFFESDDIVVKQTKTRIDEEKVSYNYKYDLPYLSIKNLDIYELSKYLRILVVTYRKSLDYYYNYFYYNCFYRTKLVKYIKKNMLKENLIDY